MKSCGLFIVFCVLLAALAGCSEESGTPWSNKPSGVRNVPDPAMQQMRDEEIESTAALAVEKETQPTQASAAGPDAFKVDLENQRVFLPKKGWLEAAAFWDIYYNYPQELPTDIDHGALQSLRSKGTDGDHPAQ